MFTGRLLHFLGNAILTLLAISFQLYYAICNSFKVLCACTRRQALNISASLWVVGLVTAVPMVFISFTKQTDKVNGYRFTFCMTQIKGDLKKMYVLGVDGDTAHVTIGYLNQTLHFYLLKTGKQEK